MDTKLHETREYKHLFRFHVFIPQYHRSNNECWQRHAGRPPWWRHIWRPAQISQILPKNTCFINLLIFNSRTVTNININNLNDNSGLWNPHTPNNINLRGYVLVFIPIKLPFAAFDSSPLSLTFTVDVSHVLDKLSLVYRLGGFKLLGTLKIIKHIFGHIA